MSANLRDAIVKKKKKKASRHTDKKWQTCYLLDVKPSAF